MYHFHIYVAVSVDDNHKNNICKLPYSLRLFSRDTVIGMKIRTIKILWKKCIYFELINGKSTPETNTYLYVNVLYENYTLKS